MNEVRLFKLLARGYRILLSVWSLCWFDSIDSVQASAFGCFIVAPVFQKIDENFANQSGNIRLQANRSKMTVDSE